MTVRRLLLATVTFAVSLALSCGTTLRADDSLRADDPERGTASERVEVSRDAWISAYPSEQEGNNGGSPKLKLKGIQEFFLIDFDPRPFAGREVLSAELHLHGEGEETLGRVSVSTIVDPWVEGTGNNYERIPGASSFLWAETGQRRWTPPHRSPAPDITGVVLGVGGSIWGFADASQRDDEGWQTVAIDPAVVQARLDGESFGFFVIDDVGSEYTRDGNRFDYHLMPNRFLSSRESSRSRSPYFTIRFAEERGKPIPNRSVAANPSPDDRGSTKDQGGGLPPRPSVADEAERRPSSPLRLELHDLYGQQMSSRQLYSARGEAIWFFVDAASGQDVSASVGEAFEIRIFDTPPVAGQVDPLLPVERATPKHAAGRGSGKVLVEVYTSKKAPAGEHDLRLVTARGEETLKLRVWNFTLPDHLSFLPQMNCYGLPGHELETMQLAHQHRTVLNQLRYGWSGKVDADAVPRIAADGTWDWTQWDARFGPLFDGTAFADMRRAGVPIEAFYLPLNENWPMEHERHFRGGYWVEDAYDDAYWVQLREAAQRFTAHFQERGWDATMFEFYLNNKVYFKETVDHRWDASSAAWVFDEPVNTQDFWALRRFGLEYWRGVMEGIHGSQAKAPAMTFRADISRPEWQRELLDGVTNVEVVSGVLRHYDRRVIGRARAFDNLVYMYGSANAIGTPNVIPAAWCVETWAIGGDGVVPWQTIGTEKSWSEPDQLSLFYPTEQGPLPSVRLKSFCAGQQLTEYLTLYCQATGSSREAVGGQLLAEYGIQGETKKRSEADAGDSDFGAATADSLETLRQMLGTHLDRLAPPAEARLIDVRPSLRDPERIREIEVVQ